MSITFRNIYQQLEANILNSTFSDECMDINIREVKLLTKNHQDYKKDTIYVGMTSSLSKINSRLEQANIILINDSVKSFDISHINFQTYIELDSQCDLFEQFNMLNNIFNNDIRLNGIRESKDLEQIAEKATLLLKNPIILIDSSYRVLAYSKKHPITDTIWSQNIQKGYCSYEFISYVRSMKGVKESLNNSTPFLLTCYKSPFKRYMSKFFLHGKLIGYLIVLMENEELDSTEKELMPAISEIVASCIDSQLSQKNLDNLEYENFLMDLLDNKITDTKTLEEKIKIYRESFKAQKVILLMDLDNFKPEGKTTGYLSKQIDKILNRRHIYYENQIVILYDFTTNSFADLNKIKEIKSFASNNNITIGVSHVFTDLTLSRKYYLQAKKVIDLKEKLQLPETMTEFKDVSFYALLNDIKTSGINTDDYLHPSIKALKQYDDTHHTNLYATLYVYLKTNQNAVSTGSQLFIHRNTVKYKIDKIIELTGIDLSNDYEVFSLMFSYRAMLLHT